MLRNVVLGIFRGTGLEFVVCSNCAFDCLLNQCFEFSVLFSSKRQSLYEPECHFLCRSTTVSTTAIVPFVNWAAPSETRTKKWKYQFFSWG